MSGEARITFEVHCAREAVVCPQTWVVKVGGSTSCMGVEENRFDGRQGGRHLHNSSSGALLTYVSGASALFQPSDHTEYGPVLRRCHAYYVVNFHSLRCHKTPSSPTTPTKCMDLPYHLELRADQLSAAYGLAHLHITRLISLFSSTAIHTIIEQVHRWYCLMWASRQHPIASPQLAQQAGNPSLFADRSIRTSGIVLGLKSPPPAQFRLWATCSPMHHPVICHHVVATPIGDVLADASLSIFYTSPRELTLAGILVRG
ncbi:hypothetical protein COCVIDRAFT_17019 [Bipolaris victoriae FI3]|uniref:Uncharacterized protein n=1 Tax=Bipolaris victoriae (strain FI3) TaxID=930091 RepID=W7ENF0_BIPV3|nr:hypothetical protein COCVIDRAFT_17019 [Bipolaris victoriae FI3]